MLMVERQLLQLHIAQNASIYNALVGSPVNMATGKHCTFLINEGSGGTGTGVLTVLAAPLVSMAGAVAIPFRYRVQQNAASTDAYSSGVSLATAAGFTTTAGANKLIVIEVDASSLPTGTQFIQLSTAIGTAGACVGVVNAIVSEPFFVSQTPQTVFS